MSNGVYEIRRAKKRMGQKSKNAVVNGLIYFVLALLGELTRSVENSRFFERARNCVEKTFADII